MKDGAICTEVQSIGTLLSTADLHRALLERHAGAKVFEGRDSYVGASEVGSCMRLVAWRKLHPEVGFDAKAAGRMRGGQVMENEAVQMVRIALGNAVRSTGSAQEELSLCDGLLRVHPDGRILRSAFASVLASGVRIMVLRRDGSMGPLESLPEGDGALEIKTSGAYGLRAVKKSGLSPQYHMQTQVQMAAQETNWGLLVMVSREDLSDAVVVFLEPDAGEVALAKTRASIIMGAVDKIRQGLITEEAGLPAAETERGYCSSCPLADSCPALVTARAMAGVAKTLPPDMVDEVEALTQEYLELKPEAERYKEVAEQLKERLESTGCVAPALPSGNLPKITQYKGRETASASALREKYPAVAADPSIVTVGEPYWVLKVARPKGAK